MFKLLALLLVALALTDARSARHRRAEADLKQNFIEMKNDLVQDFPKAEFDAFFAKLKDQLKDSGTDVQSTLKKHEGNMDLTLEELKNKLQNHDELKAHWRTVQGKMDEAKSTMSDSTLRELYAKGKTSLEAALGHPINYEDFYQKIGDLCNYYFGTTGRRFKRDATENLRDNFNSMKSEIEAKFPKDEFKAFWAKLTAAAGEQRPKLEQKLKENEGNMDLTLEQMKDKLQDDYPILTTQWNRVRSQWDTAADQMDETTLRDLYTKAKANAERAFGGPINVDFESFSDNIANYLGAYFGRQTRRYRRDATTDLRQTYQQVQTDIKNNFPKQEWDSFYGKLKTLMAEKKVDVQQVLDKNQGNMDLTLEEAKDKLGNDFPILQQQYNRIKAQWDQGLDKMDETTVRQLFTNIKSHAEQLLGRPITEQTFQEFVANSKNYLAALGSRMQARKYFY